MQNCERDSFKTPATLLWASAMFDISGSKRVLQTSELHRSIRSDNNPLSRQQITHKNKKFKSFVSAFKWAPEGLKGRNEEILQSAPTWGMLQTKPCFRSSNQSKLASRQQRPSRYGQTDWKDCKIDSDMSWQRFANRCSRPLVYSIPDQAITQQNTMYWVTST
jgi:hypothetical protein